MSISFLYLALEEHWVLALCCPGQHREACPAEAVGAEVVVVMVGNWHTRQEGLEVKVKESPRNFGECKLDGCLERISHVPCGSITCQSKADGLLAKAGSRRWDIRERVKRWEFQPRLWGSWTH